MQTVTGRYTYRGKNRDTVCGDKTGTNAGAKRHYARGEKPCEACRVGVIAYQRKLARRAGVKPRTIAECGTKAGYHRHLAQRELVCDACVEANRLCERRARQRQLTGIDCLAPKPCSPAGYAWHIEQGQEPCPACTHWKQKRGAARG